MTHSSSVSVQIPHPSRRSRFIPQLVITDVDNTLYDFGSYFEAGLRGLVSAVMNSLHLDEVQVVDGLRTVFSSYKSVEYPFPVAEFPEVQALSKDRRRELVRSSANAFWREALPLLIPYPEVRETLSHLWRDRVDVVAFTDAPIHEASRRLRGLGVDQYLRGLVATEWFHRRDRPAAILTIRDIPGFARISRRLWVVGRLTQGERKPNPHAYLRIMNAFRLSPDRVTVVGDSPERDLVPAAELGMRAVWARYGRRTPSNELLLQQVVPFKLPEIASDTSLLASRFPAINSFGELLDILPTQQVLNLRYHLD